MLEPEGMGMAHGIIKLTGIGAILLHDDSGWGIAACQHKEAHQDQEVYRDKDADNGKHALGERGAHIFFDTGPNDAQVIAQVLDHGVLLSLAVPSGTPPA